MSLSTEYKLVKGMSAMLLEDAVNLLLLRGWKLQGGPSFLNGVWVQAMTYEKEKIDPSYKSTPENVG